KASETPWLVRSRLGACPPAGVWWKGLYEGIPPDYAGSRRDRAGTFGTHAPDGTSPRTCCGIPRRRPAMKKTQRTGRVTRRRMLQTGAGLALGGVLGSGEGATEEPPSRTKSAYEAVGVKHVINATGTMTTLGGSLMPPEVVAAWVDASKHFVDLFELHN